MPGPSAGPHNDKAARLARRRDADETFGLLPALLQHSFDPVDSLKARRPIGSTSKCIPFHHALPPPQSSSAPSRNPTAGSRLIPPLDPNTSPNCPRCTVRVLPLDSLDCALTLPAAAAVHLPLAPRTYRAVPRPVLILNLANATRPGGGWRRGALAQEESLCYRTTLASALPTRHCSLGRNEYPWPETALYLHPCVAVLRRALREGHGLVPDLKGGRDDPPGEKLRIVSVVSCAAVKDPVLSEGETLEGGAGERVVFARSEDRELTRDKIRGVLRLAGREGYAHLVLGALGCGAFNGPADEVARMFAEVLGDGEFRGWFESVVFAVLPGRGSRGADNFSIFKNVLDGIDVGGRAEAGDKFPPKRSHDMTYEHDFTS